MTVERVNIECVKGIAWMYPINDIGDYFVKPPQKKRIHVLVVVPSVQGQSSKSSDAEPLLKKVKITQPFIVCQGPVGADFYSVPMETIPAYRQLSALYSAECAQLCLLYGPRHFLKQRLDSFANDTTVFVIYHSATELSVETEEAFWMALSRLCGEVASTPQELMQIIIRRKKRLFLIVDEMDGMFVNSDLTSHFLDILREWLRSPHFRGFLGIGSYDLVSLYKHHKGHDRVSPFNLATIVKTDRFTADQLIAFFKLIEPPFPFTDSTRNAIMEYSGGAPGVFGSLIRFSIDNVKWKVERHEWETWLKITTFSEYLKKYNFTYSRIRDDLQKLSTEAWKTLEALLMNGASIHRSSVGADILLRMGIVFEGTDSTVVFSSEMMR
ncbi:hypothetical protein AC1031_019280 [Aphanomyces cochlioides]|nr:hypothetical protein AC1031_019280 [Aphanomyces cochlioides]